MESDYEIDVLQSGPTMRLDLANLAEVLCHSEIANKPVAIVGIGGVFRSGKSFLLSYLTRYLCMKGWTNSDWIDDDDGCPVDGFAWKGGADPHTKGIRFWKEILNIPLHNGTELPILLFDAQGLFQPGITKEENTKLFVLSVLLCSHFLLNIQNGIDERELESLEFFTEYGKEVRRKFGENLFVGRGTPFQNLTFLIRDWQFPDDYPYGAEGGQSYLTRYLLQMKQREGDSMRSNIRSSFTTLRAFLMPHPGLAVARQHFDGRNRDLTSEFRESVEELAESLFDPTVLEARCYDKKPLTGREIWSVLKACDEAFENNEVPRVENMVSVFSKMSVQKNREEAYKKFEEKFGQTFGSPRPDDDDLNETYSMALEHALQFYDANTTFCTNELRTDYRKKLILNCQVLLQSASVLDEFRQSMGANEASDGELDMLHQKYLQEALESYQQQAAPVAALHADHVKLLEKYIAESYGKFKEMNNRRQSLTILANQKDMEGEYEGTLFVNVIVNQYERDLEKFSCYYIDEENLKGQIGELQGFYMNDFDRYWKYDWPHIDPFRQFLVDSMGKEFEHCIECNRRNKDVFDSVLAETVSKAKVMYHDTMSKVIATGYCTPTDLSKAHEETRKNIFTCVDDELKDVDDSLKKPVLKEIEDYTTASLQQFRDINSKNKERAPTSLWMNISKKIKEIFTVIYESTIKLKKFVVQIQDVVRTLKSARDLMILPTNAPARLPSVSLLPAGITLPHVAIAVGIIGIAGVTAYCVYRYHARKNDRS